MNDWLGKLPTTNARIAVTILLVLATGTVVLITRFTEHQWVAPPIEWLSYLALNAGLDIAQFHSKRVTTFNPSGTKATEEAST
ncbi:MAG TPA: hypothetical protein VEU74_12165 [Gemmatimonadales bacterium]|nr:hypothetical protein [Gemmatimonadales bacterium]